jgi:hypothetical protein
MIASRSAAARPGGACNRQTQRADQRIGAGDELGWGALERGGEMRREHQADRDRLAVVQGVVGRGLQRVPSVWP